MDLGVSVHEHELETVRLGFLIVNGWKLILTSRFDRLQLIGASCVLFDVSCGVSIRLVDIW